MAQGLLLHREMFRIEILYSFTMFNILAAFCDICLCIRYMYSHTYIYKNRRLDIPRGTSGFFGWCDPSNWVKMMQVETFESQNIDTLRSKCRAELGGWSVSG